MLKWTEKIVKIFTNILMFIVIIAVFFALYNFVQLNFMKKSYVNFFGYTFFNVVSGSMTNAIKVDDVIIIKLTDDYKVGDIVTYKVNDDFITHRIIKMDKDFVITKGDANNTSDNPIDKSVIIGKVVKIIPQLGVWTKVLMTPKVLVSILITLILFSLAFSFKPRLKPKTISNEELLEKTEVLTFPKKEKKEDSKDEEEIEIL